MVPFTLTVNIIGTIKAKSTIKSKKPIGNRTVSIKYIKKKSANPLNTQNENVKK